MDFLVLLPLLLHQVNHEFEKIVAGDLPDESELTMLGFDSSYLT